MFNPRARHLPEYYAAVLAILLDGLKARASREAIRARLQASGFQSPTGADWTAGAVAGLLARLKRRQGHFTTALLWQSFTGAITKSDALLLLQTQ